MIAKSNLSTARLILIATVILETITVVLRFGFELESHRDTASTIGVLTGGLRIHHGYCGVVIMLLALFIRQQKPTLFRWLTVVGAALILSDLIHHAVVLNFLVGSPEFHLFY